MRKIEKISRFVAFPFMFWVILCVYFLSCDALLIDMVRGYLDV